MKPYELLLNCITPRKLGNQEYLFNSVDHGIGHIFGGQFLAQAVMAGYETVPETAQIYQLSAHFLERTSPSSNIIFSVRQVRDGRTNYLREVEARTEAKDKIIFKATLAFCKPTNGLQHQFAMPQVKAPSLCPGEAENASRLRQILSPEHFEKRAKTRVFELRIASDVDLITPQRKPAERNTWVRPMYELEVNQRQADALLAFLSDFSLLGVALQPHGLTGYAQNIHLISLNHTIYWNLRSGINQWMLYHCESPATSNGRALVEGKLFSEEGDLLIRTSQQGLIKESRKRV